MVATATASILGALLMPAIVTALARTGGTRRNYRGVEAAYPAGAAALAVSALTLAAVVALEQATGGPLLPPGTAAAAASVVGVALIGLVDDLVGDRGGATPRGVRQHALALLRRRPSTGGLKALGTLALALLFLSGRGLGAGEYLVSAGLLTLTPHLFNLLDLRPGRSIKALVLLGAALTIGSLDLGPLWLLGPFLAPILLLLPFDLRERTMLGDTGASAIGAVAGLWLVLTLPTPAQALLLAAMAGVAIYGELRSISDVVERTPFLRHLDLLGRA